jgi:hypothetical protein
VQDFSVIAYSLRQSTSMIHPHHTARRRFPVTFGRMSLYVCASRPACRRCHRKLYSTELTYSRHGLEFQNPIYYTVHAPCGRESNKAKGKINSKQQHSSLSGPAVIVCTFPPDFSPGSTCATQVVTMSQRKS